MIWQRRHAVLGVLFCAYLLCYMDRMVVASSIPFIAKEFNLSPFAQGAVLSAFFVGYALMQIPGGFLADRFGPRRIMTAAMVSWSVFTALTGLAGSFAALLGIRLFFGFSEGPFPPAASKTVATWFPQREVGRANGFQLAAINIGAAVAPLFVAPLVIYWGWRIVFYSLLVPGLVLALVVRLVAQDSSAHPHPDQSAIKGTGENIRITQLLKMPAVVWCAVSLFFVNIVTWGLMNWLPTYLLQARGFSVSRMGVGASLPFFAGALGYYLSGHISDKYFSQRRHIPIVAALVVASLMTYWAAVASTGEWAIVALVLAFLFLFVASGGLFSLPLLLVPKEAVGRAFGLVNTVGQVAAFVSPLLIGYVLAHTHSNFTLVFYGLVGLFLVGACAALRIRPQGPFLQSASVSTG